MSWRVISYYTVGTPYKYEAECLVETLREFNVPYSIYPASNLGSWWKNTQQKADIILEALHDWPGQNLVWLDADARMKRYPEYFDTLDEGGVDIGIGWVGNELLSGTLFLRNNDRVRMLVERWIEINNSNTTPDQKNLHLAIHQQAGKASNEKLPYAYCCIFDRHPDPDPVILHTQASRKFKQLVNAR